ncbi:MAG TPA: type 4a pilus biogenesis protein PilO [Kofleriaceae bacterium]|nr:type 4a pilus biogenesis protein PilO [Kofleriaceae bacterium]
MADFARMPTKQKVMLFAVIGIVLGLIYYQFGYKKLSSQLTAAENDHTAKLQLNSKLEKDIPEFARLKARMINLKRMIDENQKALPTEAELPAFFDMLNRKVLESGVEVVKAKQLKEIPVESFAKVPVEYEIQGSFLQIKKFFASLLPKKKKPGDAAPAGENGEVEEKERIVSIENLSLSNPVVRNREIKLTAKFVASTFRQDEKVDPKAKDAKGAAAKPGTNPSPAAAGTPKGAKAQTENAIDKGDQRNQNATGVDEAKTPQGSAKMKGGVP